MTGEFPINSLQGIDSVTEHGDAGVVDDTFDVRNRRSTTLVAPAL